MAIVFKDKKFVCLVIAAFFSAIVNMGAMFLPYFAKWNCAGVIPIEDLCNWIYNTFGISIQLTSEGLLTPLLQIGSGISYMLSMAHVPVFLKKMDKKTFGYDADVMTKITNNLAKPLIESTTQASIIGGVNYTTLLNVIFFMLTAFGAIGLILQIIPMLFYKFDEKGQEAKLKAFREEKQRREIEELNALAQKSEVK